MKIDLELFYRLHAQFMNSEGSLNNSLLCESLVDLLGQVEDVREVKNPYDPDSETCGYVSLKSSIIHTADGVVVRQILRGDVLVLQHGWDRNVLLTQTPYDDGTPIPFALKDTNRISGYKGVWLPIFDKSKIRYFVERQLKKYQESVDSFLKIEEFVWQISN